MPPPDPRSPARPARPTIRPGPPRPLPRGAATPLLPVLLPLVVTAVLLGVAFAWWFPTPPPSAELPAVRFTDITAESGLTFVHRQGGGEAPTTLGAGVAVIDYDRDGRPDLFFVNGTAWPWESPVVAAAVSGRPRCALFRNLGGGRFADVSAEAGLDLELQGMAAAVGDYDDDGWPDLFLTGVGSNHLLRNAGDGTFTDVTEPAGVGGDGRTWSTGAAWFDADGDGRLDLVVLRYARWAEEVGLAQAFQVAAVGPSYGASAGFTSAAPWLYLNDGDGRFREVGTEAGLVSLDPLTGRPRALPLAVAPVDANGDGRLDLLITHQATDPVLFLNRGAGTFGEWTPRGSSRREGAAAGLLASGAFSLAPRIAHGDRFAALRSLLAAAPAGGAGDFADLDRKLGFALLDYEFDGRTEVVLGQGRMEPGLNRFEPGRDFARPPALFVERGDDWQPAPAADPDAGWTLPRATRGVATADFDGDGDGDIILAQHDGPARLFRNDQRSNAPWLRIELVATASAPGSGGARVEVHTPRRVHVQTVAPAMGFFAQSEPTLTFGLGDDARVRRVVVHWPAGGRQEVRPDGLNRTLVIREDSGGPPPAAGIR